MTLSVFDDKTQEPTLSGLRAALGETAGFLEEIERHIESEYGELRREWKYYTKKSGWTIALVHKRRKVLGIIPHDGCWQRLESDPGQRFVFDPPQASSPIHCVST